MTAITTTTDVPTVGGDEDVWGAENNAKWATAYADLNMLNTALANTILGRNEGSTGEVERLTTAEVAAMLPVFGADAGSGGVKGLAPATTAGSAKYPLMGDGTWKRGVGRLAGGVFSMAALTNGTTVTFGAAALNVASVSVLSVAGAQASFVITFTAALPDTDYAVMLTAEQGALVSCRYYSKTTTTVTVAFDTTGGSSPAELSVSIF